MPENLNFNIFNSIILAGILQGFVFGLVVGFSKKFRSPSTIYLTALIVAFSLNNLQYYLQDTGIISSQQLYSIIFVPFQMLSGPLLLFYGVTLINPGKPLGKKMRLLIPFALFFILSTLYKIWYFLGFESDTLTTFYTYFYGAMEFMAILFDQAIVIYLLSRLRKAGRESPVINGLTWFRFILVSFFLLSFVWIYIAVQSFVHDVKDAYYTLWIAMSAMIYWLGHIGIYQYGIEWERKALRGYSIEGRAPVTSAKTRNDYGQRLINMIVDEKRYLDPNLTLDKLAEEFQLSKSHLSKIFNAELKTSFPEYINSLRVEQAKSYLNNAEFAGYTLVSIGLEAGFNSKTTFNNAFKKATGMTPSQFKNSLH